jgi:hypothetical protein
MNISLGAVRALKDRDRRETVGRSSKSMLKGWSYRDMRASRVRGESVYECSFKDLDLRDTQ